MAVPRRRAPLRRRRLWDSDEVFTTRFLPARDGTQLFVESWHEPDAKKTALVLCDGLGCDGYIWRYITGRFRHERPILHPHYRGHGRSRVPREIDTVRVSTLVDDLELVLDAAGVEKAIFLGHSMGIQVLLEAHRRLSHRVAGLVLLCGSYEHPVKTWHSDQRREAPQTVENRLMQRVFPHLAQAFLQYPEMCQRLWSKVVPTRMSFDFAVHFELNKARVLARDFMPYLHHLGSMDMRVFARLASDLATHSARDVLTDIRAPTLIVGGGRDTFAPLWLSEDMHRAVRGSELLPVIDGSHVTPIEHPELLELRLEKFFAERTDGKRRGR
jgi:pimeloyl-ACP methyl ester carboxylesterase